LSSASGIELGFDERAQAEMLSNLLKTEHYETVLHAGDMEHIMPELIWHLEDLRVGQCYPNYYVARLAGKFVRVVLSGAGGDELFGGYPWRYVYAMQAADATSFLKDYYHFWQRLVSDGDKARFFAEPVYRAVQHESTFDLFKDIVQRSQCPLDDRDGRLNASLYFEAKTFLHGLLVVEDKISMAHSLETRVPFLDNDLADFAMRLSPRLKLRVSFDQTTHQREDRIDGERREMRTRDGKIALRQAMRGIIPAQLIDRAKQGFAAPDATWFRGESIAYVRDVVHDDGATMYRFLNPGKVRELVEEHLRGSQNRRLLLWSLLNFEHWCRTFLHGERPTIGERTAEMVAS
jgi:asparagine synthase (glutamine-hydrolysing)